MKLSRFLRMNNFQLLANNGVDHFPPRHEPRVRDAHFEPPVPLPTR